MSILASLCLALVSLPGAQEPAASMPADTFTYLEVDVGALDRGLPRLDLARLLEEPESRDFLRPLLEELGADPEHPVVSLMERLPLRRWVDGRAALGLRGLHFWLRQPDGTETRIKISAGQPLDARATLDALGLLASMRMDGGWSWQDLQVEGGLDAVLVLEPGPDLAEHVRAVLAEPRETRGLVQDVHTDTLGGRQVTHLVLDPRITRGILTDLYADLEGPRWTVTTSAATFVQVAALEPEASLAATRDFRVLREHLVTGEPVLFQFTSAAQELALLRNLVPPIFAQAAELSGLASWRGTGVAISLAEGGVHESFGLLLDGQEPTGIWRLWDAMPGGLASARRAPADAAALVAVKLDPALLLDRVVELAETLLPGTGRRLERELAGGFQQAGLDLHGEILASLGDEVALVLFPPPAAFLQPEWALLWRVRDEAGARALVLRLAGMLQDEGAGLELVEIELPRGLSGFRVVLPRVPVPPPILTVHDGWLVCAANPALAARAALDWGGEGAGSLAGDNESWQRTLRGLTGTTSDEDIALMAWVDLQRLVPLAFGMALPFPPPEVVDPEAAPLPEDLAPFFSGAAVVFRHDRDALVLDTFAPAGVLLPALIGARARQQAVARARTERGQVEGSTARQANEEAWAVVRQPGRDPEDYERAALLVREAVEAEPENPFYLNTLGVALVRAGRLEEGLAVLDMANVHNQRRDGSRFYNPATDWLFQAMAWWRLGSHEQARELLARSREAMAEGVGVDAELRAVLAETEDLIQGPRSPDGE